MDEEILLMFCMGVALILMILLYLIFRTPFQYPYFNYYFDVSGKRKPDIEELIDKFLIGQNFFEIERHQEKIENWKIDCQRKIEKSILKKYRTKQYLEACTLKKFNCQNQRSLMTKELRNYIMVRDNYTCQICGKYMPDEVGLHIDHIIPISKGGKSVPDNLQVLCSKCNGNKSNKSNKYIIY